MNQKANHEYDVIVVGSGPGGATVARQMAGAGKKVLLLERGKDHRRLGTYRAMSSLLDKRGLLRTKEGMMVLRALTTGGTTVVYSASAADPPPWLAPKYGIDLFPWGDEIKQETGVTLLPENLMGNASVKVMETANRIGYQWEPNTKFLDPARFKNGLCCGANTHLGCTCNAKWTARSYIEDAKADGATLMAETECTEILVENGSAVGVATRGRSGGQYSFRAPVVVAAAGGIGSPLLLKRAGIERAGDGCFLDPTIVIYGEAPFEGSWQDPPVSVVSWQFYDSHGIRMGTIIEPRLLLLANLALRSPSKLGLALNFKKTVGILVKVKDELGGGVLADGSITKPLVDDDHARLKKGEQVAVEILRSLGCRQKTIVTGDVKGAHPSGTCRIGDVVDHDLQTEIKGLYVCDASVFPEALDRPTVITIIAFAKRLSEHLLAGRS